MALGDANKPKEIVKTGYYGGEEGQNAAFNCYLLDLSINSGRDNPKAIGLEYCSNNGGVIWVDIVSEDSSGVSGPSTNRDSPGPARVEHIHIRGFGPGIALIRSQN
ncbi:MAG: hypothetical protein Q8K78_08355 [Planctomycetaceae bacterium]|nr:hypothetical protein [Planctomycetaceae bacterium]